VCVSCGLAIAPINNYRKFKHPLLASANGLVKGQPKAARTSRRRRNVQRPGFRSRVQAQRAGVRSGAAAPSAAEDGGYEETRWSNSKPGSGWAMRSQSGVGPRSSSQAGCRRAGAIGGGSVGSPVWARRCCPGAASVTKAMMRISAPQRGQTSWLRTRTVGICSHRGGMAHRWLPPRQSGKLSPVLLTTRGLKEITSAALQRGCQS
jgi:hypothetical protein